MGPLQKAAYSLIEAGEPRQCPLLSNRVLNGASRRTQRCANSDRAMILILTSTVCEAYSFPGWNTLYLRLEFLLWKTA